MVQKIKDLIEISQYYGKQKDFAIAGGGNTSYKNKSTIWIKASGFQLATITDEGFAELDRTKVRAIATRKYSENVVERESQILSDLINSAVNPEKRKRPSVETSFHEILDYAYVVHTHPTIVNALMCSNHAEEMTAKMFGDEAMFVPYAPGYDLFRLVDAQIIRYRSKWGYDPHLIFLQNHGIFVSADTIQEIKDLYEYAINSIKVKLLNFEEITEIPCKSTITEILPAIRMMLSVDNIKVARIINNSLIAKFYENKGAFSKIALPFTPDMIVYCKAKFLYIDRTGTSSEILSAVKEGLSQYKTTYNSYPKLILIKDHGLIALDDNDRSVQNVLDVYEDLIKVSYYSENFGGPHYLSNDEITFIEGWEVEIYRSKLSKAGQGGKLENKVAIVTGAAQGFGAGIAEDFIKEGANVVIADLNEAKAKEFVDNLNNKAGKNRAFFVKTDIGNPANVQNLIYETVREFGGLDVLISNAGILRAGGLDEMSPEAFDLMTKVNYTGFFYCAKYAAPVLKQQAKYKIGYFSDIIQINSKSGLKGSNRNFAYAGGKFGSIGLVQSFALELIPYRIKVNAICPGNFFDGPLWADPENGLFVQYLRAGKVPGATSIADVKRFYEQQVPAGRGCNVADVMKAIYYVVEQEYETGQAIPVTGGQIMLK